MWLKIPQSALDASGQKAIFSSGALGSKQVTFGGLTLTIVKLDFRLNFKRKDNGGSKWKATSVETVEGDKWMHVTGTWAVGGTAKLYVDGTLNSTATNSTYNVQGPVLNTKMIVGKLNDGGNHAELNLDEWYFWDRELTGDQAMQVYTAYQTGTRAFRLK